MLDLARLLQAQERWAEAFAAVQRAQAIAPSTALLVRMAGLLVRHYRQALLHLKDTPDAELHTQTLAWLGVALHQLGRLYEAIQAYSQALRLRPDWSETNAHREAALDQLKAIVLHVRQTLQTLTVEEETRIDDLGSRAARAAPLTELAVVLHRAGCLEEALALCDRASRLAPDREDVPALRARAMEQWNNPALLVDIARRFNLMGLFAEVPRSFERACALAHDNTALHLDRGLTLLRSGRFSEGWPLFAARRHPFSHRLPLPPWQQGQACGRLLLLPEQDIGDQILFASMLSEAPLLAASPTVLADPQLHALFALSFPQLRVLSLDQPLNISPFQAQLRVGCLGTRLRPSKLHFLAQRKAYLKADPATTQLLRRTTGLDVMANPEIDTIADIDNVSAFIAACDLVVTVSNTTAHLAGALGQRTWVLIDSRLDWRLGLDDADALWYPNARLFRQASAGDWATPLSAVRSELKALRRGDTPAPAAPSPPGRQAWVF